MESTEQAQQSQALSEPQPQEESKLSSKKDRLGFFEYTQAFTSADWEIRLLYLYRLQPITDRRVGGNTTSYLAKYSCFVDEDMVMKEHGSGEYRLQLNKSTKEGSNKTSPERQIVFKIMNPAYPPKIPQGEWVDDPRNKDWAWAKAPEPSAAPAAGGDGTVAALTGLIRELLNTAKDKKPGEALETSVVPRLVDMFKTASDQSIQIALSQVKQGDPDNFMKMLVAFKELFPAQNGLGLEKMIELLTRNQNREDPLVKQLAEDLRQSRQQYHELMMKKSSSGGEEGGLKGTLETIRTVLGLRDELGAGGGGMRAGGWKEALIDIAPQVLERVDSLFGKFLMLRNMAAPASNPGGPGDAPNPTAQPGLNPGRPGPGGNALQLLNEIAPPLISSLTTPGVTGGDFAEWFIDGIKNDLTGQWTGGYGIRLFDTIKGIGKQGILTAARAVPALWAQLEPIGMERVETFLDEFLNWEPTADEPEPDEPQEPTSITKGKKSK